MSTFNYTNELSNIPLSANSFKCSVCKEAIDTNTLANCVICDKGHRAHKLCPNSEVINDKICAISNCGAVIKRQCQTPTTGYGYVGGKNNKIHKKKSIKRRTNYKKKSNKRRTNYKKKSNKRRTNKRRTNNILRLKL